MNLLQALQVGKWCDRMMILLGRQDHGVNDFSEGGSGHQEKGQPMKYLPPVRLMRHGRGTCEF